MANQHTKKVEPPTVEEPKAREIPKCFVVGMKIHRSDGRIEQQNFAIPTLLDGETVLFTITNGLEVNG